MNIGGIGEQKVKEHGRHIVATIWSFLQRNNLLFLFPEQGLSDEHPPYDIPLCPTWRDPMSTEAELIRATSTTRRESPIKTEVSPYQKTSPLGASSNYLPYSGFNSTSNPSFDSPPPKPPADSSHGLYTYHSRPGAAPNPIQRYDSPLPSSHVSVVTPVPQGSHSQSFSRNEHPYARYLNQRSGDGGSSTLTKRPSPSASSEDENNPIRRRVSETESSSHIADPTYFLVSPDN